MSATDSFPLELSYSEARIIELGLCDTSQEVEEPELRDALRQLHRRLLSVFESLWDFDRDPTLTEVLEVDVAELEYIDGALGAVARGQTSDAVIARQLQQALRGLR